MIKFLIILLIIISCETETIELPFYNSADFTPEWITPNDENFKTIHTIGHFNLTDQNGKPFTEKNIENKLTIVDFFFTTCPGICKDLAKNMRVLQREYLNDSEIHLMSISSTPEIDSVSVLKAYGKRNGQQDKKWSLLTGNRDHIYDIAKNNFFAEMLESDVMDNEFIHTENMVLIDKKGRIRGVYNGTLLFDMRRLITDVAQLKKSKN